MSKPIESWTHFQYEDTIARMVFDVAIGDLNIIPYSIANFITADQVREAIDKYVKNKNSQIKDLYPELNL